MKLVVAGESTVRPGDEVGIDVERLGKTTVGLRLRGIARHVSRADPDAATLIGVKLVFLSPQELRTAKMLFAR